MKYKILLVSALVLTTLASLSQGVERFSDSPVLTNQWAMVALFWSGALDAPAAADGSATSSAPETKAVVSAEVRAEPAQDAQGEFRWQGRVQPGQTFEIKGVNGNVRAEGSNGNQLEVLASKKGRRSDPASVEIRVVEHAGGVTICAVYPSDDASRPNECQAGRGGHMNVRDNDVSVDFMVKVPAGVRFAGRTVNGSVEATGIGGDVEATTVNGSVNISASGIAQGSTVNGSIKATMGNANWSEELSFSTVNGSITLDFPAGLSAEVRAETLNGEVISDFPMNVQSAQEGGRGRPKRVSATIGSGGRSLSLKTINGDVRLRRGAGRAL
jgi:hypothetical protein